MGKQQYHFVSMAEAKKLKKGDIIFIGLRNGTSLTYQKAVVLLKKVFIDLNADDSIVRNIQPQFKTEEEPVINENTETDLEK